MKDNNDIVKQTNAKQFPILASEVQDSIVVIRDIPVMLDADVAFLYVVETKRINEAVRNNPDKFPADYMFTLDAEELSILRSKFSSTKISSKSRNLFSSRL